jgi:YD repeat-containing protein
LSVQYQDGSREDFTYYKDNLLMTLLNTKADNSIIERYSYKYDAAHNQTSKEDSKGTTRYIYDRLNRLAAVFEPWAKGTFYEYDAAGNRSRETIVKYSTKTDVFTYKDGMNIVSFSFYDLQTPGTMVESPDFAYFEYDAAGNKGSTAVAAPAYTYDEQNLTEGAIQSINFAYKVNGSDTVIESANYNYYEFDAAGNRSTENAIITTTVYTYNEQNRLTGTVTTGETNESTSYTYDNNGNLLTEQKGTNTTTHSYDEFNQLKQTVKGSTTIKAKYNGEGKRVEREINGAVTRFLYEGSNIILEVSSIGDELARNIYGTNLIQRKVTGVNTQLLLQRSGRCHSPCQQCRDNSSNLLLRCLREQY